MDFGVRSQSHATMRTEEIAGSLRTLISELIAGVPAGGGAYVFNSGDIGLLRSLDRLSAVEASQSVHGGATIAAHTQHVRYGFSLMNRWAAEGGDPFSNALWDAAWKISAVDERQWSEIRAGVREEAERWLQALGSPRDASPVEVNGMIGSIAHLAYHVGAIRQIAAAARGPREGTFG